MALAVAISTSTWEYLEGNVNRHLECVGPIPNRPYFVAQKALWQGQRDTLLKALRCLSLGRQCPVGGCCRCTELTS